MNHYIKRSLIVINRRSRLGMWSAIANLDQQAIAFGSVECDRSWLMA
ncbi:MAG: hypothetical protein KAF91_27790 [Nostoc sp. TH1S01]|nr:hypothetical protein [Nostoc sp. TH1S01]